MDQLLSQSGTIEFIGDELELLRFEWNKQRAFQGQLVELTLGIDIPSFQEVALT